MASKSPEYVAFQRSNDTLKNIWQALESILSKTYAAEIITENLYTKCSASNTTESNRVQLLLNAVHDKIKHIPDTFHKFVEIIGGETAMQYISGELTRMLKEEIAASKQKQQEKSRLSYVTPIPASIPSDANVVGTDRNGGISLSQVRDLSTDSFRSFNKPREYMNNYISITPPPTPTRKQEEIRKRPLTPPAAKRSGDGEYTLHLPKFYENTSRSHKNTPKSHENTPRSHENTPRSHDSISESHDHTAKNNLAPTAVQNGIRDEPHTALTCHALQEANVLAPKKGTLNKRDSDSEYHTPCQSFNELERQKMAEMKNKNPSPTKKQRSISNSSSVDSECFVSFGETEKETIAETRAMDSLQTPSIIKIRRSISNSKETIEKLQKKLEARDDAVEKQISDFKTEIQQKESELSQKESELSQKDHLYTNACCCIDQLDSTIWQLSHELENEKLKKEDAMKRMEEMRRLMHICFPPQINPLSINTNPLPININLNMVTPEGASTCTLNGGWTLNGTSSGGHAQGMGLPPFSANQAQMPQAGSDRRRAEFAQSGRRGVEFSQSARPQGSLGFNLPPTGSGFRQRWDNGDRGLEHMNPLGSDMPQGQCFEPGFMTSYDGSMTSYDESTTSYDGLTASYDSTTTLCDSLTTSYEGPTASDSFTASYNGMTGHTAGNAHYPSQNSQQQQHYRVPQSETAYGYCGGEGTPPQSCSSRTEGPSSRADTESRKADRNMALVASLNLETSSPVRSFMFERRDTLVNRRK